MKIRRQTTLDQEQHLTVALPVTSSLSGTPSSLLILEYDADETWLCFQGSDEAMEDNGLKFPENGGVATGGKLLFRRGSIFRTPYTTD